MAAKTIALILAIVSLLSAARADEAGPLNEAVKIVIGQREETRVPGIRRCFIDVLQKVSGDQSLAHDGRVDALAASTTRTASGSDQSMTSRARATDRRPQRRVRPRQDRFGYPDARSRALDDRPPPRGSFRGGAARALTYLVSTDGPHGYGQADAFTDAANKVGVPVVVPSSNAFAAARLSYEGIEKADPVGFEGASSGLGAAEPLVGSMVFSDADFGWIVSWRFSWHGTTHRWQVKGVNFDAAFLNGMRGVAQIASNYGAP